mmetsp:Transcript_44081/g.70774  ORF Transcript_44081/g.70774 Transcript_44081/m.70774 type:complete len:188 (-) Transcript_44081:731-1294(-)
MTMPCFEFTHCLCVPLVRYPAAYDLKPNAKAHVRILIAEDNILNQKVVTKLLRTFGFDSTVVTNNGKEARDKYVEEAEAGRPFDLVLMDLQMPVMDGFMATQSILEYVAIKESEGRVGMYPPRIVALTADVLSSVIEECRSCGMFGFIGKPIRREKLAVIIGEVAVWVTEVGLRKPRTRAVRYARVG